MQLFCWNLGSNEQNCIRLFKSSITSLFCIRNVTKNISDVETVCSDWIATAKRSKTVFAQADDIVNNSDNVCNNKVNEASTLECKEIVKDEFEPKDSNVFFIRLRRKLSVSSDDVSTINLIFY